MYSITRSLAVLALTAVCLAQTAPPKKRVAVMNFDYGTVQSYSSSIFGTNVDIGKGIADMLVEKLVQGGNYSVIERKVLDKIIAEQNFSNSDRADANSAAKIGKILGVDAIIVGSITEFGRDDKHTNVGGGGFGGYGARYGLGGIGKKEAKAVVAISGRMINTETAEILTAFTGKGQSTRSGTVLLGAGGGGGSGGGGGLDMGSSNFANSIIGEATTQAVNDLATQLNAKASSLPTVVRTVEGVVADVSGGAITINVGARAGVHVGDTFNVMRVSRVIKDPSSGKVIRSVTDNVGTIVITEVDDLAAVGKYSGPGGVKVGDSIKSAQ